MGMGSKGYQSAKGVLGDFSRAGGSSMFMRGIVGAGIGGAMGAGYDAITGKKGSAARMASGGFLLGAIAGGGRNFNRLNSFFKGNPSMNNLYGKINNIGISARRSALNSMTKSAIKNPEGRAAEFINKYGTGAAARQRLDYIRRGVNYGVGGAAVGAVYGGWSDQESMISGAMKGALIGAAGGAMFGKRMTQPLNPLKVARGTNFQSPVNANARSQFVRGATSAKKSKFRTPQAPEQGPSMDIEWGARTREAMNRPKNMRTPQDFRDIDMYNSNAAAYRRYQNKSSTITGWTRTNTGHRVTYKI